VTHRVAATLVGGRMAFVSAEAGGRLRG
jgi:hypothetical protein